MLTLRQLFGYISCCWDEVQIHDGMCDDGIEGGRSFLALRTSKQLEIVSSGAVDKVWYYYPEMMHGN